MGFLELWPPDPFSCCGLESFFVGLEAAAQTWRQSCPGSAHRASLPRRQPSASGESSLSLPFSQNRWVLRMCHFQCCQQACRVDCSLGNRFRGLRTLALAGGLLFPTQQSRVDGAYKCLSHGHSVASALGAGPTWIPQHPPGPSKLLSLQGLQGLALTHPSTQLPQARAKAGRATLPDRNVGQRKLVCH